MPVTPFIPVPGTVQCTIEGEYFGDKVLNNLYFKKIDGIITPQLLAPLVQAVDGWWASAIVPYLSNSYNYLRVNARDLTVANGLVFSNGTSDIGGLTQPGMPGNVTLSVSFQDGFAHRGGKPGNRISGLVEPNVVGNSIAVDWAATIVAGYNVLPASVSAGGTWAWVTVSRYFEGQPRAFGINGFITAASVASYKVHTMRRRVNGR